MTIYQDSKRIVALQTDISKNIVTINHRCSTTDDHAYADLGSALSNTSWVMRYKMVISGYSASSTNPNNAYLFAISQTTANNMSDQSLGLKMRIGGGSGYSDFFVGGGTSSQNNAEGYEGSLFSSQTTANGTWYVEYIRDGSSFSIRLTTSSDYTGGELDTWSTSGTVENLRYIKYTNRDDNTSSHVLVATISEIKIYDGVTSATGTFVRDGTWTASASNKVTVATEDNKPTDVQDNSILIEKDTARIYWRTPESTSAPTTHSQNTEGDVSGIDAVGSNPRGGWGQQVKTGHPLVGKSLKTLTVKARFSSNIAGRTDRDMTVKVFAGLNSATIRGTSDAVNTSTFTTAGTWYDTTFTFATPVPISADDCILVCIDGVTGTGGGWNSKIKSSPEDTNKGYWVTFNSANYPPANAVQTNRSMTYTATYVSVTPATWTGKIMYDGSRGVFAGGSTSNTTIDYITIATLGNATDFGDLTVGRNYPSGMDNATRGVFAGGGSNTNVMDYITILTTGNATDFGDLTVGRTSGGGLNNSTRGVMGGGNSGSVTNVMDYITIATTGNATDFGDLTLARSSLAGLNSDTRGVFGGGANGLGAYNNNMDYITVDTTGNATDFGDLTAVTGGAGGISNLTRGLFTGGYTGAHNTKIDYITIATTGNATSFGNMTVAKTDNAGVQTSTRGVMGGGSTNKNNIDYVTIATLGNATDFGDLTVGRHALAGVSNYAP